MVHRQSIQLRTTEVTEITSLHHKFQKYRLSISLQHNIHAYDTDLQFIVYAQSLCIVSTWPYKKPVVQTRLRARAVLWHRPTNKASRKMYEPEL